MCSESTGCSLNGMRRHKRKRAAGSAQSGSNINRLWLCDAAHVGTMDEGRLAGALLRDLPASARISFGAGKAQEFQMVAACSLRTWTHLPT